MKIIVGNWKMNPTSKKRAKVLFFKIEKELKKDPQILKKVKVVICPPFLYLPLFLKRKSKISLGAQNVFFEEKGAFTGEISPRMLKGFGVEFVILGHSERRKYFGETDEMIEKKLKAVLKFNLKPILCIGETEKERKEGKTFKVLKRQLKVISNLKSKIQNLILAYEPVWAIGTKNPCDPEKAREVFVFLRRILKKNKILYGGSVDSKNAKDYIEVGFNGLLIGGASLNPKEFVQIIKDCSS